MNEVFECRSLFFFHLFYVGHKHNAKYFGPGELRSNAAKYKLLKQSSGGGGGGEKRQKRGRCLREKEPWQEGGEHHTIGGGGRGRWGKHRLCETELPKRKSQTNKGRMARG